MTYQLALAPTVDSVGVGRRLVAQALAGWRLEELAFTATLLTSEVLTNSVLHARTPILLTVERTDAETVSISVRDGSTLVPHRRQHPPDATTGRGLELLDRLAQSWQVTSQDEAKTLTFTVSAGTDPWAAYSGVDWSDAE